ncbi:hypothetical protein ANN_14989 [Periplaneta americana]|uniref:Uncharacterized protein n=1 Tax=Periplaneta americana TaxID=6978 RepID=A0ABQ8SXT4_PERAM|nr:hypothetical protein ANN_14989 [Periplaneta americana]
MSYMCRPLDLRVYATRPQTLDDLKHIIITQEIQAIDNRVLQRVASNMVRRVELCLIRMEDIFNICYRGFLCTRDGMSCMSTVPAPPSITLFIHLQPSNSYTITLAVVYHIFEA